MTEHQVDLAQERLVAGVEADEAGSVRVRKRTTTTTATEQVERGEERTSLEHAAALEADDGEVHLLDDGSVSVPVFEERLVVTRERFVRERVVLRKHTVYEQVEVSAPVRREHLDLDVDEEVGARVTGDLEEPTP
ncbi:MAG: DUF2382 domain-containing protein [Mycobacteriales bacterium]